MPQTPPIHESILRPGAAKVHRRKQRLIEFTHSSTRATMLMVGAALLAFLVENIESMKDKYAY